MSPKEAEIIHRRHTFYYYKEDTALQVKALLDKLHTSKNPVRIRCDATGRRLSIRTVKAQYYQGALYLQDILDPDGHYAQLYKLTKCYTYSEYLELHVQLGVSPLGISEEVVSWKTDLEEFLEKAAPGHKFERKVALLPRDITWIEAQLASLVKHDAEGNSIPMFFGEVSERSLLLVRDTV